MNGMLAQIDSLPALIRTVTRTYDAAVRTALEPGFCSSLNHIYMLGCGDSHHASLGTELAFEQFTGLPTEALTALQFARYAVETLPRTDPAGSLVIGTSVSGEVVRTLEGLLLADRSGASTLALTANPFSRIGRAARRVVDTAQPPFQDPPGLVIPGVRSYVANQLGLLLVALRIGESRGHLTGGQAAGLRSELEALAEAAEATIALNRDAARQLAADWQAAGEFVFLGSGPNYASALFSAAKMLEACGDPALGQDTEEWAHLQYFARQADTPTFLIGSGDRDRSRMIEVATAARQIGRRVVAVVPASVVSIASQAQVVLPLSEGVREVFSPVISAIPTSLFAAWRADVIGEPFFRGFGGGRSPEGGGGISRIRTSELLDGLDSN